MIEIERCKLALANTIILFRIKSNLKRKYLADSIGKTAGAIDKMEQSVSNPKFIQIVLLFRAMDISLLEFIKSFEDELAKMPPPPQEK